jgi:uncharacterized caspase-like protein
VDSTFLAAVLTALIAAAAGFGGAYLTTRQSREIERQRLQQELSLAKHSADQALQFEQQKHAQELELERQRLTQELRAEYDKDLRQHRLAAYEKLWQTTGTFPLYAQSEPVTREMTQQFAVELRKWYFDKGGIFLTDAGRDAYFAVQAAVKNVLERHPMDGPPDIELPPDDYESVRAACSALRSKLVSDVGTRRESELN